MTYHFYFFKWLLLVWTFRIYIVFIVLNHSKCSVFSLKHSHFTINKEGQNNGSMWPIANHDILKVSSNAEDIDAMTPDNHNTNPLDYSWPCTVINDHDWHFQGYFNGWQKMQKELLMPGEWSIMIQILTAIAWLHNEPRPRQAKKQHTRVPITLTPPVQLSNQLSNSHRKTEFPFITQVLNLTLNDNEQPWV